MTDLLSIAYVRPEDGKDQETLQVLSELYALMRRKGYSRDLLYRDLKQPHRYVNLRYWSSEDARDQAHEDPDVHRLWQRLAAISSVEAVSERLELVPDTWSAGA